MSLIESMNLDDSKGFTSLLIKENSLQRETRSSHILLLSTTMYIEFWKAAIPTASLVDGGFLVIHSALKNSGNVLSLCHSKVSPTP